MAKLDIGVGEDFPLEEKPCREDRGCSGHGYRHHFHHHHGSLHEMWRRHFGRGDAPAEKSAEQKDKE